MTTSGANSRELTQAEYMAINEFNSQELLGNELDALSSSLEYQGYNPAAMWRHINDKSETSDHGKMFITHLIAFGVLRGFGGGKTWQSIYDKTAGDGVNLLKAAVSFYQVKIGKPDAPMAVTIPRLLQSYPMKTYQMYVYYRKKEKVGNLGYVGTLPVRLQWIGSPSVMNTACWNKHKSAYVDFSMHCSAVWKKPQDASTASSYAELLFKTPLVSQNKRLTTAAAESPT